MEIHTLFNLSQYEHAELLQDKKFPWECLGILAEYLLSLPLGKINGEVSKQAFIDNEEQIYIGSGSIVEPGAYIKGPCYIGENCTIRHGAYVRGNVLTGDNCVLGHSSEFKNSILLNDVKAAHFAYVGDSILGNNVMLGAGVKCANLKLNRKNIRILYDDTLIDTGTHKLGLIAGDDSKIGCNSVANPGTILNKAVLIEACKSFSGYIINYTP